MIQCDLLIGIYAWRYGYIPDSAEVSITEQEYWQASKSGIPCLCYFVDEEIPWIPKFIELSPAKEKLKKFKDKISKTHVRDKFTSAENLKSNLVRDMSNWLVDNRPELNRYASQLDDSSLKLYLEAIAKKYETLPVIGFKRSFDMDSVYIPLKVVANCALRR